MRGLAIGDWRTRVRPDTGAVFTSDYACLAVSADGGTFQPFGPGVSVSDGVITYQGSGVTEASGVLTIEEAP